jgi:pyruvate dehydrogenase E2 component (dihydrolipoamide acetyltransferase)
MATKVIMPKLEMAQESATIIEWLKKEGEQVKKGEPLLVIETDKVTVELESPGSGSLSGVRGEPGQEIPVTEVIAYLLEPGEKLPKEAEVEVEEKPEIPVPPRRMVEATPVARRLAESHAIDLDTIVGTGPKGQITKEDVEAAVSRLKVEVAPDKVRATPAARRVAREQGVDLVSVRGTGPRGQITAEDVEAHVPSLEIATPTVGEKIPLQGMRQQIARRMTQSFQTAPHISVSLRVNMAALEKTRAEINAGAEAEGRTRVSITALIVKAAAEVLQRHPWLNSTLHDEVIHIFSEFNIGVAVALEEGLIVPVIHDVDKKDISQIAAAVVDLAERARESQLELAEVSGGTFTVSNLGPFGVEQFTAIINPPQAAILAVGAIHEEVVPDPSGQLVVRPISWMTLTADHRVVDGAVAAKFLTDLKDTLENPESFVSQEG